MLTLFWLYILGKGKRIQSDDLSQVSGISGELVALRLCPPLRSVCRMEGVTLHPVFD